MMEGCAVVHVVGNDLGTGTGTCIATTTIILKYGTVQVMHITINYDDQSMRLQRIFSRDSLYSRGGRRKLEEARYRR